MSALQRSDFDFHTDEIPPWCELLGLHFPNKFSGNAVLRRDKPDDAINHRWSPEPSIKLVFARFVWVVEPMESEAVAEFSGGVIMPVPGTEFAGFDVAL